MDEMEAHKYQHGYEHKHAQETAQGIIIPKGYEGVIIPNDKFGILKFGGEDLEILATPREVFSSEDAAEMRGYPLNLELKTSLLDTSNAGPVLVHVPGQKFVNMRAVKDRLKSEFGGSKVQAFRAGEEISQKFHCVYGTLNPFSAFLAALPQFVSEDLLDIHPELIGTNAGTLNRFVRFNSHLLLKMKSPKIVTGEFSKADR
jgi:prolyl-tRNA editing enzyme YbaK/EbsC (Cys-tRNA(Pro) deacylase)